MRKDITIKFKDGVPISNAKDPKTRREAEAFGAAFLRAAKEGRDTLHIPVPNPELPEDEQAAVRALIDRCGR